jgi:hypothetical protein
MSLPGLPYDWREREQIDFLTKLKNLGFPLASCAEKCIAALENEGIAYHVNFFRQGELPGRACDNRYFPEGIEHVKNANPGIGSFHCMTRVSPTTRYGVIKVDDHHFAAVSLNDSNEIIEVHEFE